MVAAVQLIHVAQSFWLCCPCILLQLDLTLCRQLFVACSSTKWFKRSLTMELPEERHGSGELLC